MNRRSILATGAGVLTYSVAGCLGSDGGGGDPIAFEQWLPSPDIFGRGEYPAPFRYFNVPQLLDQEDALGDSFNQYRLEQADPVLSAVGLSLEDLNLRTTSPGLYSAVEGDFDVDAITETVEGDERFSEASSEGERTIYTVTGALEKQGAFVLADGVAIRLGDATAQQGDLIFSPTTMDLVEVAGAIYDASQDESRRYTQNEHIAALVDELGTGDLGFGEQHRADETSIPSAEFSGQEAWGAEFDVDGDTTQFTEVFVFASGEEPPESQLNEWLGRETPHRWGSETSTSNTSLDIQENVAVVTGEFNTGDGFQMP